jgi:hypothetical protein
MNELIEQLARIQQKAVTFRRAAQHPACPDKARVSSLADTYEKLAAQLEAKLEAVA